MAVWVFSNYGNVQHNPKAVGMPVVWRVPGSGQWVQGGGLGCGQGLQIIRGGKQSQAVRVGGGKSNNKRMLAQNAQRAR